MQCCDLDRSSKIQFFTTALDKHTEANVNSCLIRKTIKRRISFPLEIKMTRTTQIQCFHSIFRPCYASCKCSNTSIEATSIIWNLQMTFFPLSPCFLRREGVGNKEVLWGRWQLSSIHRKDKCLFMVLSIKIKRQFLPHNEALGSTYKTSLKAN